MMRPEPIREIAPPAWPLPLISSLPRGPRRHGLTAGGSRLT